MQERQPTLTVDPLESVEGFLSAAHNHDGRPGSFAPPPQLVVTQSTTSWNATLHFFDGTLRARAPPQQPHAALPPERRSPAGGASRAALSARQWLAQGFFEPWSPFPRSGMQRCAGDVTDTYIEIKKAMNEIGEQTTSNLL